MNQKVSLNYSLLLIPIALISILALLPMTSAFEQAPSELSTGILLDLMMTLPIVYFLLIRKTKVPNFTVLYAYLLGILLASLILPVEHQGLLAKIKYISIPVIEISILGLVLRKVFSLRSKFKQTNGQDVYDRLVIACQEIFPSRLAHVLATEIAMFYYLFSFAPRPQYTAAEFTYFKKSGITLVIMVFLFLMVVETFVLHLLVAQWNTNVAWVLSILGIYAMLQIISVLRSMNRRPILIDEANKQLILRYGFGCQTIIPFDAIERIEQSSKTVNDKQHTNLSLFDLLDATNLILYLNREQTMHKLYGLRKQYQSIALFVDEKQRFVEQLEQALDRER